MGLLRNIGWGLAGIGLLLWELAKRPFEAVGEWVREHIIGDL